MSRPRIGLNCDVDEASKIVKINQSYVDAVVRGGGWPMLLAPVDDPEWVASLLSQLDGLVLTGGRDYDPALYGRAPHPKTELLSASRVRFDLTLARAALSRGLPTLGICGGIQLLNVARGGTLIQDIPDQLQSAADHHGQKAGYGAHTVRVEAGTRLAEIVGAGELEVNSSHHQAIDSLGAGLRVAARAPDGVIEAVEGTGDGFLLGVQWHPERLLDRPEQVRLFEALAEAARPGR
jgi:putative glutamine amidotransferase